MKSLRLIEGKVENGVELDKRFYAPGVKVHDGCPKCGEAAVVDLGDKYLEYPRVGMPTKVYFDCKACEHSWAVHVVVGISVELVKE